MAKTALFLQAKLAWRNLMRNRRRTIITGIGIGIGLASLIFTDAYILGLERSVINAATESFLGEGQIHRAGFREQREVDLTIAKHHDVMAALARDSLVKAWAERVVTISMVSSAGGMEPVSLLGINPDRERALSQFDEGLIDGSYFQPEGSREIIIGARLAQRLKVDIGDRLVVTASQATSGEIVQELFRLSGIYEFGAAEIDQGIVVVRLDRAQAMMNLDDRIHEIAIRFHGTDIGRDKTHAFWSTYSQSGNHALGWTTLLPEMEAVFMLTRFSILLVAALLFAAVALTIVNTLFMSLYERMYEFGVLRAVGTQPGLMARLVMLEAGGLAVVASVCGVVLASAVIALTLVTGIPVQGLDISGVTLGEPLYPVVRFMQYVEYPFWVLVMVLTVAIYPARHAARLTPAVAMRKSL